MSYWRKRANKVIAKVIEQEGTEDLDALEKSIRASYPFGDRAHWPYKVWLSAVNQTMRQLRGGGYKPTPKDIRHWWVPEERIADDDVEI